MLTANKTNQEVDLTTLSDGDLLAGLRSLAVTGWRTERSVIEYLLVIDQRKLYLKQAEPSLYEFTRKWLNASDSTVYRRLKVMGAARSYPIVLDMLGDGKLNTTALSLLSPVLTPENHETLLASCVGLSIKEVERKVAGLAPKPASRDDIRPIRQDGSKESQPEGHAGSGACGQIGGLNFMGASDSSGVGNGEQQNQATRIDTQSKSDNTEASGGSLGGSSGNPGWSGKTSRKGTVTFKSETRVRISFDADSALADKIAYLKDLHAHKLGGKGIEAIVDMACEALLEKTDPARRIARRKKSAAAKAAKAAKAAETAKAAEDVRAAEITKAAEDVRAAEVTKAAESAKAAETDKAVETAKATTTVRAADATHAKASVGGLGSRYIPVAESDAAWEESGGQCCFVSEANVRCSARGLLQREHCEPFALGGTSDRGNIKYLCRAHNLYAAEQTFGADAIARAKAQRAGHRKGSVASGGSRDRGSRDRDSLR